MELLTRETAPTFLTRFWNLDDAVIRSVKLCFLDTRRAEIVISAQDQMDAEGWSNVRLVVEGVAEFMLHEDNRTCVIIGYGFAIHWFDDKIAFDFQPVTDFPDGIDDVRKSRFYVMGTSAHWTAMAYSEQ